MSALSAEQIRALHDSASARRPGVRASLPRFEEAVAARVGGGVAPNELFGGDLLLVVACLEGDPSALQTFEREVMTEAARSLLRLRLSPADADDVLQRVRTRLLVGDEKTGPRLASYAARGSLVGWVRASVVHEALSARRAAVRRGPHDGSSALDRMPGEDADLGRLRELYAAPFRAAFAEVLASLTPRDRNVLRLVYIDGLTAEQVGAVYGVHRVSVARWIGQIRHALFERTRTLLCDRLGLQAAEVESITRLCLSQIDVSLDRLL